MRLRGPRTTYGVGLVAGCVGLVVGVVTGIAVARVDGDPEWLVGRAVVGDRLMTVVHDDTSYGVSGSVPAWYDAAGSQHQGGWPDCLRRGEQVVRFTGARVALDAGATWTVTAVDCR